MLLFQQKNSKPQPRSGEMMGPDTTDKQLTFAVRLWCNGHLDCHYCHRTVILESLCSRVTLSVHSVRERSIVLSFCIRSLLLSTGWHGRIIGAARLPANVARDHMPSTVALFVQPL